MYLLTSKNSVRPRTKAESVHEHKLQVNGELSEPYRSSGRLIDDRVEGTPATTVQDMTHESKRVIWVRSVQQQVENRNHGRTHNTQYAYDDKK